MNEMDAGEKIDVAQVRVANNIGGQNVHDTKRKNTNSKPSVNVTLQKAQKVYNLGSNTKSKPKNNSSNFKNKEVTSPAIIEQTNNN